MQKKKQKISVTAEEFRIWGGEMMVLENIKSADLWPGVSCTMCGETNDALFFPIIFKNGSKGVVCLNCIIKENPKWEVK